MEMQERRTGRDRRSGADRRQCERRDAGRVSEERRHGDRRRGDRRGGPRGSTHDRATVAAQAPRGPSTILVVDDEPMVRTLLQAVLRRSGYTVLVAGGGVEALEVLEQNWEPVHLVLTDMQMPGMDGLDLARRLAVERPEVKVLFMSGHHPDEVDPEGVARSSAPYLAKPFSVEVLLDAIRSLLVRSR